jgi:CubicO group peptidase (beta-lactamase class C family)
VNQVPPVHGSHNPRFAGVLDAFAENFRLHDELGAALTVLVDGVPVVDIWGGWADADRTRPWERDTLVDVFSVGKAMAALCVLVLADRGQVDLEAPVARYWPEFAQAGKAGVTLRVLLAHRAGLPAVRRELPRSAIYDWGAMTAALAAEEPWWEPDSTHGYHVNTLGFLAGEIVRRASGRPIGAFFRHEVAEPLGADFHFGVGAREDARIAEYVFGPEASDAPAAVLTPGREFLLGRVYLNPPELSGIGTVNTREWRGAEIPSANGHATALGVAKVYSGIINGLLSTEMLARATSEASAGADFVLDRPSRFGLGFQLTQAERPLGPNPRSFGHFGAGGSLGFADPDAGLAFGYVINHSGPRWQNPRNRALIDAVYACLM